jgi:hypothetical protein
MWGLKRFYGMCRLVDKNIRVEGTFCVSIPGRINLKLWCLSTKLQGVASQNNVSNPIET